MASILVTGGARSGKSRFAQEMALNSGKRVLFVATATAGDEEMRQRIEEHRRQRPPDWRTLEAPRDLGNQITRHLGNAQLVIVDCMTLLVSNILGNYTNPAGDVVDTGAEQDVMNEVTGLIDGMGRLKASFIIVTNEVGMGLVPVGEVSRIYRDLLGKANQVLAEYIDVVYLMVAGLPLRLKPPQLNI